MASKHYKYPFLTGLVYADREKKRIQEFVGIIHNVGKKTTSLYDYGRLIDDAEKKAFIEAGRRWWNESNRTMPISYVLPACDMDRFQHTLIHLMGARVTFMFGPETSLEPFRKRGKLKTHHVTIDDEGHASSTTVTIEDPETGEKTVIEKP